MLSLACALLACLGLSSCAPHMYNQQSLRPFKQQLPPMPAGATPTKGRSVTAVLRQEDLTKSPLKTTPQVLNDGRIYYGYYCLMCHGANGDGNGPVGESYVPKPADLSSPAVQKLTDGQLYRRMLTGTGHDPVMIGTTSPDQRWPLVAYVRTLAIRDR